MSACATERASGGSTSADTTRASTAAQRAAPADTDDFGVPLPTDARFASRVVSLNPTATEVIFAFGADSALVGRSRWDEFPAEASRIPALGDGIKPNVEAVLAAKPSLVVLYATAENRAAADAFRRAGIATIALRVDRVSQFMSLCARLGVALGRAERAGVVADSVQQTLDRVRALTANSPKVRVVWPLWQSPVLVVGGGSYIDELLEIAGATNVFHEMASPSPQVSVEEIAKRDPQVVIASEKSAKQLRASAGWQAVRAVRENRIVIDDPKVTGRPSVVLGMAAVSLAQLLHPELAAQLK